MSACWAEAAAPLPTAAALVLPLALPRAALLALRSPAVGRGALRAASFSSAALAAACSRCLARLASRSCWRRMVSASARLMARAWAVLAWTLALAALLAAIVFSIQRMNARNQLTHYNVIHITYMCTA